MFESNVLPTQSICYSLDRILLTDNLLRILLTIVIFKSMISHMLQRVSIVPGIFLGGILSHVELDLNNKLALSSCTTQQLVEVLAPLQFENLFSRKTLVVL